ncbi:extracellular solute-binding protein [Trueperella sp. LYQ143]|uniref:extracellular solute-binding protein n=1 Tax=unclassified Trueperella TaxID=2630174 RepID=UPI003983345D
MKRSVALLCSLALPVVGLSLTGCGGNDSADDPNTLVVYTARSEALNNAVIPQFEKETGIKVEVVTAGTGELIKRVKSEGDHPLGDVLWAADETMLSSQKDMFEKYTSPEDANMPAEFKNKSGYFTPAFADPTVMVVNKGLAGSMQIKSFADLLNPELKGKIAFGDPVNSSSAFQVLMAMLYTAGNGDPMSKAAWDYVDKFLANLDGKIANSSSQVYKGVANGEYVVGLTWEDPAANLVKSGADVEVVFPAEGAIFPGESVQIIKGAAHLDNAKKFVDFMINEETQNRVGETTTVRPLRTGAKLADYMTPTDKIKLVANYDEAWVAENKAAITEKYSEHRTDAK